jgi:hypothetical protein
MATYKGKKVTTREIETNDPRFNKLVPSVLIVRDDGTEIVAPKSEVTEDKPEEVKPATAKHA